MCIKREEDYLKRVKRVMAGNFGRWLAATGDDERSATCDFGLLVLRFFIGFMMLLGHGSDKLIRFAERAASFPDPLGLGSTTTLVLAVSAEFFCSLAIIFGFMTRLAVIPLMLTMLVAAFIVHGADPWAKQELAMLFLIPYLTLLLTGPGKFSLDRKIFGQRR